MKPRMIRPKPKKKGLEPLIEVRREGDKLKVRVQGVKATLVAKGRYFGQVTPEMVTDLEYQVCVEVRD